MSSTATSKQIPEKLKRVLVIGSGGRENSLAWALSRSTTIEEVLVTPGNAGTEDIPGCQRLSIEETDGIALAKVCKFKEIDLIVIGPETPLANGLADELRQYGLIVFGPGKLGARLESSKTWAKKLMMEAGVPTAKYWEAREEKEAIKIVNQFNQALVVKADGLAAGKGVIVSDTLEQTKQAIHEIFKGRFGEAGTQVLLEERLSGPEISVFALCDGKEMVLLPPAQDHKRLYEGDKGPNTGGMGAYAPAPLLDENSLQDIKALVLQPILETLCRKGIDYRGVIYAGLMLTQAGPKVIEFNCRFGDPECQALMPLMGPELAEVLQACSLGCLEKSPNLSIQDSYSACVVAASAGYPESPELGVPISIELQQKSNSLQVFHAGTSLNDKGQLVTAGGRVLSVVGQGSNLDEAFQVVYQGMKKVSFKGITYRSDIGHQVRKS